MTKRPKTGGRRAGTPNRTTVAIKEAIQQTFELNGGIQWMAKWAKENPSEFFRLASKLVPTELKADVKTEPIGRVILTMPDDRRDASDNDHRVTITLPDNGRGRHQDQ